MIIEISGIDGSGKTSLSSHLCGMLVNEGISPWEITIKPSAKRLIYKVRQIEDLPSLSHFGGREAIELAAAVELLPASTLRIQQAGPSEEEVYIAEPYVLTWLATAAGYNVRNLAGIAAIYRQCPNPDLSVFLRVDPDTAIARIHHRPRKDRILLRQSREHLEAYIKGYDTARSLINYSIMEVDSGSLSLHQIVTILRQPILERISTGQNTQKASNHSFSKSGEKV